MIKVVIADDHAILRKGVTELIREQADMQVVGEAENGTQTLEVLRDVTCDVLVLDLSMPNLNGFSVLEAMRIQYPHTRVLVLSTYPDEQFGMRVLKAGGAGYLNKTDAEAQIVVAIRKVMQGGKYISAQLAEHIAFELGGDSPKSAHEMLSDREYDVMRMIGAGKPPIEIARELSLSPKTISTYRGRVLEKLGLRTNAELIRYVYEHHLV